LLDNLVFHNMGSGYTCFVSSFMIFTSDKEVKLSKSVVLKSFANVNSISEFKDLNLPIINEESSPDKSAVNTAFEIDLSQPKLIEKKLDSKKMDCYPLLYVKSSESD
jgi:plastocyanin domain-containing protein